MLTHLLVRNLAIVDEVEVELDAGMTTLTGETGAGKSILIDALGLALGERADSDAVRAGTQRAEVTASFELAADTPAAKWLVEHDLNDDEHDAFASCVLRRAVTREGRSRGYINGNPVPMQALRELGGKLVDICGQQAHQSLARAETQRGILDYQGDYGWLLDEYRAAYADWQALAKRLAELESGKADQTARLDLLRFQSKELEAANIQPGESEALERQHKLAANISRLHDGVGTALQSLYEGADDDDISVYDRLAKTLNELQHLSELDDALKAPTQLLLDAQIQIDEAVEALRHYLGDETTSEASLTDIEERLGTLLDLARKHRVQAAELPALAEQLAAELSQIEHIDENLDHLREETNAATAKVMEVAERLSNARTLEAKSLEKSVAANMALLGMPDGQFLVHLARLTAPGPNGLERVEFQVSMNPGMPPGPLAKVASGGELSRISLAIQVVASARAQMPTMIFDEVDAGVGGGTADIVGSLLRDLAQSAQVMCVTHLPQVASKGHAQFRVSKLSDGDTTHTTVVPLNSKERVEEIARMLGGVKITQKTRAHAREMLGDSLAEEKAARS